MQQNIDPRDALEDLDPAVLEAHMRFECAQATLAYGQLLEAAGHIAAGWAEAVDIDRTPPWRRAADRIGDGYGVSFDDMRTVSSQSHNANSRLVRRARDHVFFALHREHGMRQQVIAVLFALRDAGGICKAAQRHARRLAAAGD